MTESPPEPPDDVDGLGDRAIRTRQTIIDAARTLFLDRGYSGVRISNITDACGISRAGFYTYFRDKDALFRLIGEASYHDAVAVIRRWDDMPDPPSFVAVEQWVRDYFAFMDVHGAFIFSSTQSAPPDEAFRAQGRRVQMRVVWMLGTALRTRQVTPTDAPDALGLMVMGLLEQAWFRVRFQQLPVTDQDMIDEVARAVWRTLRAS